MKEILEVSPELEQKFKNSIRIEDNELLQIFPESKTIIPEKLMEWESHKKRVRDEIQERLLGIAAYDCGSFTKWFLREFLKYQYVKEFTEIRNQISRLQGLQLALEGKKADTIVTREQIERAKTFPIENLLDSVGKCGKYLKSLCPFHEEKTPSFYIFPDNRFKCFGCGEYGNSIDFLRKQKNLSFIQAVKILINHH